MVSMRSLVVALIGLIAIGCSSATTLGANQDNQANHNNVLRRLDNADLTDLLDAADEAFLVDEGINSPPADRQLQEEGTDSPTSAPTGGVFASVAPTMSPPVDGIDISESAAPTAMPDPLVVNGASMAAASSVALSLVAVAAAAIATTVV